MNHRINNLLFHLYFLLLVAFTVTSNRKNEMILFGGGGGDEPYVSTIEAVAILTINSTLVPIHTDQNIKWMHFLKTRFN